MKVWILIYTLNPFHSIEMSTYNTFQDCDEVAYYMAMNLTNGATVQCEASTK